VTAPGTVGAGLVGSHRADALLARGQAARVPGALDGAVAEGRQSAAVGTGAALPAGRRPTAPLEARRGEPGDARSDRQGRFPAVGSASAVPTVALRDVDLFGTGRAMPIAAVAEALARALDAAAGSERAGRFRAGDVPAGIAEASAISRAPGFAPCTTQEPGLEQRLACLPTPSAGGRSTGTRAALERRELAR
jgi:nucleoside-diphosphate-sugar epimerase